MPELIIQLSDTEWDALTDLADAQGRSVDDTAQEAVNRYLSLQETLVRTDAMRLAQRHGPLLRRLGQ